MNVRKTILAAVLLTACSATAHAADTFLGVETGERRFYWGLNYGSWDNIDLDHLMFVAGADVTNLLGFEVHLGKSDRLSQGVSPGITVDLETKYIAAAFARATLRFQKTTLYALGGYGTVKYEVAQLNLLNIKQNISGPAYGAGMEWYGGPHTALNLSWIRYVDDGDNTIDTFNIGIVHHFDWPGLSSRY